MDATPIHPLFIGIYRAITLYYLNIQEIKIAAIWQAIITSLAMTLIVAVFYTLIFRSWARATLPTSFTLLLVLHKQVILVLQSAASLRIRFLILTVNRWKKSTY